MEKKIWLVGIGGTNADGVIMMRISATEQEIKEFLVNLVKEDKFTDPEAWEYGTDTVDEISNGVKGFYAYAVYSDYHIDYQAILEMPVVDVSDVSFTYLEEPEFNLPTRVNIPKAEVGDSMDDIADILSDKYGFCVLSYAVTEADDGCDFIVSDIEWDTSE